MCDKLENQYLCEESKRAIMQARKTIIDIHAKGKLQRKLIGMAKDISIARIEEQAEQQLKHDRDNYDKRNALLSQITDAAQKGDLEEMKRIRKMLNKLFEK